MTEERKHRMRQHFRSMLLMLKDGEIHVVPFGDESGEVQDGDEI